MALTVARYSGPHGERIEGAGDAPAAEGGACARGNWTRKSSILGEVVFWSPRGFEGWDERVSGLEGKVLKILERLNGYHGDAYEDFQIN